MKKTIILLVNLFLLFNCKLNNKEETKIIFSPQNESIKKPIKKESRVIDSCKIGELASLSEIPNKSLFTAIKNKNLNLLLKNLDADFFRSYEDYSSNKDLLINFWKANNKNSSFWVLLNRMITHGGYYEKDSTYISNNDITYVLPIYASRVNPYSFNYDCDNKIVVVLDTYIYKEKDLGAIKLKKVKKNKVLTIETKKTTYKRCERKYSRLGFPEIEEFDECVWYYIPKYKGYINGTDVWHFGDSSLVLRKNKEKWLLYVITAFD